MCVAVLLSSGWDAQMSLGKSVLLLDDVGCAIEDGIVALAPSADTSKHA